MFTFHLSISDLNNSIESYKLFSGINSDFSHKTESFLFVSGTQIQTVDVLRAGGLHLSRLQPHLHLHQDLPVLLVHLHLQETLQQGQLGPGHRVQRLTQWGLDAAGDGDGHLQLPNFGFL